MTTNQKLYYEMLRIRLIEEAISIRYKDQRMRCPVHLSIGQEATAVGICSLLDKNDLMVGTHRGHAFYLAKGGSLRGLLCELYGKRDGCSRGQGGSMHLVDWSCGFAGSTSIVSGTVPVGVGLAFAKKLRGEPGAVVVCIGDAAVEEGVFHEAANFAVLHELEVIFYCENNLYSCYTHIDKRQPKRGIHRIAFSHGMDFHEIENGNNVYGVKFALNKVVDGVRTGSGPQFVVANTYRRIEHCGPSEDDHLGYREETERAEWYAKDPLILAKQTLIGGDHWSGQFENEAVAIIQKEIEEEFEYAIQCPFPGVEELGKYTYATTNGR